MNVRTTRILVLLLASMIVMFSCGGDSGLDNRTVDQLQLVQVESFKPNPSEPNVPIFNVFFELIVGNSEPRVSSIDIYLARLGSVRFEDQQPVLIESINVTEMLAANNLSTLPIEYAFSLNDLLSDVQVAYGQLNDRDILRFSWEVNLTNGEKYSASNADMLSEGHPFRDFTYSHDLRVDCIPEDNIFVGRYNLENITVLTDVCDFGASCFSFQSGEVEIEAGDREGERIFTTIYKGFLVDVRFFLQCNKLTVPTQGSGLICNDNTILWGLPIGFENIVNFADDSSFQFKIIDDLGGNCSEEMENTLSLTRIE